MPVYAIKGFERFRRKERISGKALVEAVDRAIMPKTTFDRTISPTGA